MDRTQFARDMEQAIAVSISTFKDEKRAQLEQYKQTYSACIQELREYNENTALILDSLMHCTQSERNAYNAPREVLLQKIYALSESIDACEKDLSSTPTRTHT